MVVVQAGQADQRGLVESFAGDNVGDEPAALADLDDLAERKPIQIVTTTVMSEKPRMYGSIAANMGGKVSGRVSQ